MNTTTPGAPRRGSRVRRPIAPATPAATRVEIAVALQPIQRPTEQPAAAAPSVAAAAAAAAAAPPPPAKPTPPAPKWNARPVCVPVPVALGTPGNYKAPSALVVVDAEGQRWFQCPKPGCGHKVRRLPDYNKHYRGRHDSARLFECRRDGCGKTFKDSTTRCRHERTHDDTIYKCPCCDRNYTRKDNLNMHIRKVHPGKVPATEACAIRRVAKSPARRDTAAPDRSRKVPRAPTPLRVHRAPDRSRKVPRAPTPRRIHRPPKPATPAVAAPAPTPAPASAVSRRPLLSRIPLLTQRPASAITAPVAAPLAPSSSAGPLSVLAALQLRHPAKLTPGWGFSNAAAFPSPEQLLDEGDLQFGCLFDSDVPTVPLSATLDPPGLGLPLGLDEPYPPLGGVASSTAGLVPDITM